MREPVYTAGAGSTRLQQRNVLGQVLELRLERHVRQCAHAGRGLTARAACVARWRTPLLQAVLLLLLADLHARRLAPPPALLLVHALLELLLPLVLLPHHRAVNRAHCVWRARECTPVMKNREGLC